MSRTNQAPQTQKTGKNENAKGKHISNLLKPGVGPAASLAAQSLVGLPGYMRDTIKKRGLSPIVHACGIRSRFRRYVNSGRKIRSVLISFMKFNRLMTDESSSTQLIPKILLLLFLLFDLKYAFCKIHGKGHFDMQ